MIRTTLPRIAIVASTLTALSAATAVRNADLTAAHAWIRQLAAELRETVLESKVGSRKLAAQIGDQSAAAIEAAHAGSYGRGFAVVAAEIRSLAKNAGDIKRTLGELATKMNDARSAGGRTGESFRSIRDEDKRHEQHEAKQQLVVLSMPEERAFAEFGFERAEEHRSRHAELVEHAQALRADLDSGKPMVAVEVMQFLRDWVTNHIQREDSRYSSALRDKPVEEVLAAPEEKTQ
jgi:hemerythrin-like metal-binding protein